MRVDLADSVRRFWDADAATYDRSPDHGAATPTERAAWSAALARLLPPAPARVLDAGAGTGFLSLGAARLGYQVTAVDLSPGMLARLRESAEREGLSIEAVEGGAEHPPPGQFDAVIERLRQQAREGWRRLRREPDHHHGHYDAELVAELPLATGAHPDEFIRLVEQAGWGPARMERLRDRKSTRL